jgi:2-haloacid dehalogenase
MISSSIQAIIFDFGGVLINWDPRRLFGKFFSNDAQRVEAFMKEINFSAWNLSQDEGRPFSQAVSNLSAQFPQYAHIINAYDIDWEQSITGTIPETIEILHRLKTAGCRLYGLTNWSAEKFAVVRHKYKFFDLFEEILVSGEVKLIKPDPAIFQLLLQKIQHVPQECLLVDDSLANIKTAREMGFATHHFTSSALLEGELTKLGLL